MPAHPTSRRVIGTPARRIGMVSTYPPKLCGLATFAAALSSALRTAGHRVDVVRVNESSEPAGIGQQVAAELVNGSAASLRAAAVTLSRCDTVIVQHEYGIFGGPDGDEVLQLLDTIAAPTIVVLHTVPLVPTAHQREVLEAVCSLATRVVVMTESANARLCGSYAVDASRVEVISHGAALAIDHRLPEGTTEHATAAAPPQLLTWGLLGPGKGIEYAIDAVASLATQGTPIRYTIAGVTHPKVFARSGDAYRQSLIERARTGGVAHLVDFDDTYRNVGQLTRFVASADLAVLPYESRDQVTSGVLVDALAAGTPVIATAFPHATELVHTGAVIVVPHADSSAMADAICAAVTQPAALIAMTAAAQRVAPSLSWAAVADRYLAACAQLDDLDASVAM